MSLHISAPMNKVIPPVFPKDISPPSFEAHWLPGHEYPDNYYENLCPRKMAVNNIITSYGVVG